MIRPSAPPLLLLLSLAGCAADHGHYPSLAPRPGEKLSFDEPVRPVAIATPDAALDAQLSDRARELDRIAAGFATAATAADARVAAAEHAAVGSDAWLDAQAALARLDDWRSQGSALVAGLEDQGAARAARLAPAYPALDALAARAATELDRESGTVDRLQHRLPAA